MSRWSLVVALCACSSACKIVHSTAGDGGVTTGPVSVGFSSPSTRLTEAAGAFGASLALSAPSDRPVTVTFTATDDTATSGVDYVVFATSVTFQPGQTSHYIEFSIQPDADAEPDESFLIDLLTADGATLDRSRHVVTIAANAVPTVTFDLNGQAMPEWMPGYIGVSLTEESGNTVMVNYSVGGTATAADRFVAPGSIYFAPGTLRQYIDLGIVDDTLDEPDETIILTLTSADNALLGPGSTYVHTIADDDSAPYVVFSTSYQRVAEGNVDSTVVLVSVYLTAPSPETVTVPFTLDATTTAVAGEDFTLLTQSPLTLPAGTTAATIMLSINGDATVEGNEIIGITLGMPTNALIAPPQATTIEIGNEDCLGSGAFAVCPTAPLAGSVALPAELDTDTSPHCTSSMIYLMGWAQANQPESCVVFARTIAVDSTLVRGNRPLILAATDSITVTGLLDVSGQRGYASPGVYLAPCSSGSLPGAHAGGAGGSFMTRGGDGGGHTNPSVAGGTAGPAATQAPATLRGGCLGEPGYGNFTASGHGNGGGAVYLAAGSSITIQPGAAVNASGGPGVSGSDPSAGGSGGGSGGMIMLYAPMIQAAMAYLVANGGGGSEGSTGAGAGNAGAVPNPTTPFVAAAGGTGTQAGNGGSGFAQGSPATSGSSANNTNGGGGGGGGGGYITANQPLTDALVSPTAQ